MSGYLNKKETKTNMPVFLKLDKHKFVLSVRGLSVLNVGSVMSVNESEHFKNRLTI